MLNPSGFLALLSLLVGLPPEGYVDIDKLVRSQPQWSRVDRLRQQAARLRQVAESVPAVAVPPVPDDAAEPGERLAIERDEFEQKAVEVELRLLREALGERIRANRQRTFAERSRELDEAMVEQRHLSREEWWAWERALTLSQRVERISMELQLFQGGLPPAEEQRLTSERAALDAVAITLGEARRREHARALTRSARQQVESLTRELDSAARGEERVADQRLAHLEIELEGRLAEQEAYRLELARQLGETSIDLELGPWRRKVVELQEGIDRRHQDQGERYRSAAEALEAEAAALTRELGDLLRPRVLASLRVLEQRHGVVLHTEPADGLPDVTAEVADLLTDIGRPAPLGQAPEREAP